MRDLRIGMGWLLGVSWIFVMIKVGASKIPRILLGLKLIGWADGGHPLRMTDRRSERNNCSERLGNNLEIEGGL